MEDKKRSADELFDRIADDIKSAKPEPKPKPQPERSPLADPSNPKNLTMRMILDVLVADYNRKLGLNFDLQGKGPLTFSKLIDKADALPFMAHALSTTMHFDYHVSKFGKTTGTDMGDLKNSVFIPAFLTCAGIATRIHRLGAAPDIDISSFDTSRIDQSPDLVNHIIHHIESLEGDNRQKWIAVLCYDVSSVVTNVITSILPDRSRLGGISEMLSMMSLVPILTSMSVSFLRNMATTSHELDKL